ncbi:MAG: hypothetical protein H6553_06500 [Chitinophagales bacterium]|nr:hypothetical protein [Chitinophagales bacterium]
MILFADSGSTKTHWVLVDTIAKTQQAFITKGINPIIHFEDDIKNIILANEQLVEKHNFIKHIYFFGAGCSSNERKILVQQSLQQIFRSTNSIQVDEDMVGNALAVCSGQPIIACILGTGSNSILFDGTNFHTSNAGIGYILGDEASGAYFGKLLCRDFIYQTMPKHIMEYMKEKYDIDRNVLMQKIYKDISPNRYLAQFTQVMSHFRTDDYIQTMLKNGFQSFIDYHIKYFNDYKNYPIGFIGSIAAVFETELKTVLLENELNLKAIIKEPIDNIVEYFLINHYA